jgi:hypothetical protein
MTLTQEEPEKEQVDSLDLLVVFPGVLPGHMQEELGDMGSVLVVEVLVAMHHGYTARTLLLEELVLPG